MNKIKSLAVEGGGVGGLCYIGALQSWIRAGYSIKQWDNFAGSSAGSILCAFLAVRAPMEWMENEFKTVDFNDFADDSWGIFSDIWRLIKSFGWHPGNTLRDWIALSMKELTGNAEITLAEVKKIYGTTLIITKTDMLYPRCELVVMSPETHPDMVVADAVRASCGIPLYFQACKSGPGDLENHLYMDGGVLLNYPIELLPNNSMGLYLQSGNEYRLNKSKTPSRPIANHLELLESIGKTWREQAGMRHIHKKHWGNTVLIPDVVGATRFDITEDEKELCVKTGYEAMESWILRKTSEK